MMNDGYFDRDNDNLWMRCVCGRGDHLKTEFECSDCAQEWEDRFKSYCYSCGAECFDSVSMTCAACEERWRKEQEEEEAWYLKITKEHEEGLLLNLFPIRPLSAYWRKNLWEVFDWFILSRPRMMWALWKAKHLRH